MNFFNVPNTRIFIVVLGLTSLIPLAAAQDNASKDETGWYSTFSLGHAKSAGSTFTQVSEGGKIIPIRLNGITEWGTGSAQSLTVGRQFRFKREDEKRDSESFGRLEVELLHARIERERFNVGVVNAPLSDRMNVNGVFVNGLWQFASTTNTRWWVGAGIGRVKGSLPNAVTPTYPCGCLGPASGSGVAYRLKLQAEFPLSERTALFGELGYVRLPSQKTLSPTPPITFYEKSGFSHLSVGVRVRF